MKIDLSGCLSVVDADGVSRTPRGQKTCAALALLATAPKKRRARRWIQSKLWSDRAHEQANGSLRQSLAELRKSFGPFAPLLMADRKDVWLEEGAVQVILPGDPEASASTGEEFLSGIDVRDDAFDDWLREMRQSYSPARPAPIILERHTDRSPPLRLVVADPKPGDSSGFVTSVAGQEVAKYVCERTLAVTEDEGVDDRVPVLEIRCEVNGLGATSQAHFQAIRRLDGVTICSRFGEFSCEAHALLTCEEYRQMIPEFGEQIISKLQKIQRHDTDDFENLTQVKEGIAGIFSYEADRLTAAEGKLMSAYKRTGNPSILIWLAWQKTTEVIEEATDDKDTATEMARYYCSKALEAEPHSAFANAMSSLVHMIHFDDIEASFVLADRASGLSKFDPYVQAALATANMFAGRPKEAARNSLGGTRLSRFTGNAHWWDLSHSLFCLSSGDLASSEEYALRASRAAPKFRAPKRVLLALYASQNRVESAVDQMHALKRVEPTFSMDRFLRDPEYPITTVRNAGLLRDVGRFDL